jgi:D-alanyl-lipoteichoic acid acyltransferase DltB (MBOAT superfamily)
MLFNSSVFLFWFLPIALVGYYLLAHKAGAFYAKVWLCVGSFVFYGWWNPAFLLLLTGSIAFNYWLSRYLTADESEGSRQGWILGFGVAANLLLLFYYKYLFPLLGFLHQLGFTHVDYGSVILPIGISFFTFTQIGYLVDCRQGLVEERGLLNYVLFVTFFPHLIAGPILHHREIMPQFSDDQTYRFRSDYFASGLTLFCFGLIKKVLLADSIAPWAEQGFAHVAGMPMLQAWSVALAYSMQLYFDFSGYSDMAVGLGSLFGVKLPLNFNSPYKSASIVEFWQRWHMTLTRYLTLLLYNPISLAIVRYRKQKGLPTGRQAAETVTGFSSMVVFPTLCTMFLAGLWHGAGFQYIVYGVLHGAYLSINHLWRLFYPANTLAKLKGLAHAWGTFWRVAVTYVAVLVAQIFFRADSAHDALQLLAGTIGLHGSGLPLIIPLGNVHYLGVFKDLLLDNHIVAVGLRAAYNESTLNLIHNLGLALGLAVIAFGAPNVYQLLDKWSPALAKVQPLRWPLLMWRPSLGWALLTGVLLFFAAQHFDHTARFLYFQF